MLKVVRQLKEAKKVCQMSQFRYASGSTGSLSMINKILKKYF